MGDSPAAAGPHTSVVTGVVSEVWVIPAGIILVLLVAGLAVWMGRNDDERPP